MRLSKEFVTKLKGALLLGVGVFASCRSVVNEREQIVVSLMSSGGGSESVRAVDPLTGRSHNITLKSGVRTCFAVGGTQASAAMLVLINRPGKGEAVPKLAILSSPDADPVLVTGERFPHLEEGMGSLSPDGTMVVFPIFEQGNRHSSIWVKDLRRGTLKQISSVTTGNTWDYFPTWLGDSSGIVYHHMIRNESGRLDGRIMGYVLNSLKVIDLTHVGPVVGIAYALNEAKVFAAWTAAGLELFRNDGDATLVIPMSWCAGRLLSPGTMTWNRRGDDIIFALYDRSKNRSELYDVSVSTKQLKLISAIQDHRIINVSLTR